MRLVVTGTQGQVARSLGECRTAEVEVVALGRPALDFADTASIAPALAAAKPDVVINAAAFTAVDRAESEETEAFQINATAAAAVAAATRALDVPLIHLSTDYVFDGSAERPYREDDRPSPLGVYGRSKLEGERTVAAAQPDHVILRTAWVYSPFGHNFLTTMLRLGESRAEVSVVADQFGAPTYAPDIARAIVTMAQRLRHDRDPALRGIFHMTGSGEASWALFARAIFAEAAALGRPLVTVRPIGTADYRTAARRPANSRLDCGKLARVFNLAMPDWRLSTRICVRRVLAGEAGVAP